MGAQTKAKKQKQKAEKVGKKSKGGSDSGSNSRASTPVNDRPASERRNVKRSVGDDEMSTTSSKDDEVSNPPFPTVNTKETRKKNKKEETVEDTVENILSDDKIDNK